MKNLAEFYNLKCEKSVQPMGSTSAFVGYGVKTIYNGESLDTDYWLTGKVC